MRRDYFTCVFLASIAGALAFICFEPLYFTYGRVVPREFGLFECIASSFYLVLLLIAIPIYAGYKRKYWIAAGLACYGLLAYIPGIFYPSQALISGDGASIFHVIVAACLRGIYGMVNAPFASLSRLWGDNVAMSLSRWILPTAILIPFIIRLYRFYSDAYVAEQLSPADVVTAASNSKFDRKAAEEKTEEPKPEVLGTVISAPVKDIRPAKAESVPEAEPAPVVEPAPTIEPAPEPEPIPLPAPKQEGEEPILLGPPKTAPAKPSVRQPVFDMTILGEEAASEGTPAPEDRE